MMTLADTIAAIEHELRRIGAAPSADNITGLSVYGDAELPSGWVRVDDGTTRTIGPAEEMLQQLRSSRTWGNAGAWDELVFLGDFIRPESWPDSHVTYERLTNPTDQRCKNPVYLITIRTNAGPRYAAGPHGDYMDLFDYACDRDAWHPTPAAAMAALFAFLEDREYQYEEDENFHLLLHRALNVPKEPTDV